MEARRLYGPKGIERAYTENMLASLACLWTLSNQEEGLRISWRPDLFKKPTLKVGQKYGCDPADPVKGVRAGELSVTVLVDDKPAGAYRLRPHAVALPKKPAEWFQAAQGAPAEFVLRKVEKDGTLVGDKIIIVQRESGSGGGDSWSRTVTFDYGTELIRLGLAKRDPKAGPSRSLQEAEKEARAAGLGVWAKSSAR